MGKASSSKKVARAARAGGRGAASRSGPSLGWPVSIVAIVVLGGLLIWASRGAGDSSADVPPRILEDHWHAAYGIWACDRWLPPMQDQTDPQGIHSHGDGVFHVHPFSNAAAGENATLERITEAIDGFDISDDRLRVPDVGTFTEGETDCDGEPAQVRMLVWDDAFGDEEPSRVLNEGFTDLRLTDRSAIAIVFAPEDVEVGKPPTVPVLNNLSDVPAGGGGTSVPPDTTDDTSTDDTSTDDTTTDDTSTDDTTTDDGSTDTTEAP